MSNIDTRSSFFPRSRSTQADAPKSGSQVSQTGGFPTKEMGLPGAYGEQTSSDARVSIPDGVKDFSRIKKAVNQSPEIDNSEKIAQLKAKIQAGNYEIDYDAVADKMLQSEF